MAKKTNRQGAPPPQGIHQAPTAPSVSGQANNSEAAKALGKTPRRKKKHREADGLTGSTSTQSLTSEESGKRSKRSKKRAKGGDGASVDGQNPTPEGKKKKKSKKSKDSTNLANMPNQPSSSRPQANNAGTQNQGNSNMHHNGSGSARGSRESTIIGTGHFVASSLPQHGKKRKLANMLQGQQGQSRYKKTYTPWCADIDWFSAPNMTSLLNDEILACSAWMSPTFEEHEARTMMVSKIKNLIQQVDPGAQVYAFGSHETKLYLPGGDIDIVVDSTTMRMQNPRQFFYQLITVLVRHGVCRQMDIEKVFTARVPIIKIKTIQGSIKIDISVYNTGGVKAGEVVKEYLDALPAARPLVLLVKAYMWKIHKNEVFTGGMGSYSTICLAISFLQQHPKIRNNEIDPMKNLGILLIEFFELYGLVFNWEKLGISIREGGSYFDKKSRGWHKNTQQPNMAIEDPQDQTNDIAKGTYQTFAIFEAFRTAYETLVDNIKRRAEELRSWQAMPRSNNSPAYHDNWTDNEGRFMPQSMSLLRDVIGFDEVTLDHRAGLEKLYHSRDLHRELGVPFVPPPMTARQAQAKQSHAPVPSAENFSVNIPSTSRGTMSIQGSDALRRKRDTVSAIMMDEEDPEEVGQVEVNEVFDSDSEMSDGRQEEPRQPPRRRIITPPDSLSSSSRRDAKSVIEVSDSDSEEESTRYKLQAKRRPVSGSKEAEMDLGTDSEDDSVISVDDDDESDDDIEILDDQPAAVRSEVPVVHFSETTSRPRNEPKVKPHTARLSDTIQGRHTAQNARGLPSQSEERISPPAKKIKPSRSSRQQFWQSKSGVESGSSRREQDADQSGEFEGDWQADLEKARAEALGRDAVAANDDFISF